MLQQSNLRKNVSLEFLRNRNNSKERYRKKAKQKERGKEEWENTKGKRDRAKTHFQNPL